MTDPTTQNAFPPFAPALIRLLQGVVDHTDEPVWAQILRFDPEIREYFRKIGVDLHVSEADGYAFVRQADGEETEGLPRLVRRVPLNYTTTLLCVLLRERLLQHDTGGIDSPRLVISRSDIHEAMSPFFRERTDQTQITRRVDSAISHATSLGFIKALKTDEEIFEIRRILKAVVTADKLAEIKQQLNVDASDD